MKLWFQDDHNALIHSFHLSVPHNSPTITTTTTSNIHGEEMVAEEYKTKKELDSTEPQATNENTELSFTEANTSTPKENSKRKYRRRVCYTPAPVTRSSKKISSKSHDN